MQRVSLVGLVVLEVMLGMVGQCQVGQHHEGVRKKRDVREYFPVVMEWQDEAEESMHRWNIEGWL